MAVIAGFPGDLAGLLVVPLSLYRLDSLTSAVAEAFSLRAIRPVRVLAKPEHEKAKVVNELNRQ